MRFNNKKVATNVTKNYMGSLAYNLPDKAKLLNLVGTCMINEVKYYGDIGEVEQEILDLCRKIGSEYILQLANYARNELYLRSVSIYLLAIASHVVSTKKYVRKYAPLIIRRADEINEVVAAYINLFGKPIPNCLKKGIADSFTNFDEYQFKKYSNSHREITLKDVILLTHPAAYNKKATHIVKKILDDELSTSYTWESVLSIKGNTGDVWDELIRSHKLGYMATIRNLRNMVQAGATEIDSVVDFITNDKAIMKSRQLPFRFLSAYESLGHSTSQIKFESDVSATNKLRDALNVAITKSTELNIPKISGKTIILCDNSGSARGDYGGSSKISVKSVRTMADIGNLLGLLLWYSSENAYFAVFGDQLIEVNLDRKKGILENFEKVDNAGELVGAATEQGVFTCFENMIRDSTFADRIIVCSDLQIGNGENNEYGDGTSSCESVPELLKEYRKKVNPDIMYYSVCFNGYGNDIVVGDGKVLISGWSDNILKFIQETEKDSGAQIRYIEENFLWRKN